MKKLVVLKLEEGRSSQEIAVSLEIGEEGKRETTSKSDRLNAPPNINVLYNNWKTKYKQVIKNPRVGGVGQPVTGNPQEDFELCQNLAKQIKTTLNQWYQEEFNAFKETLAEKVKPSDTIRLVIQTDLLHLQCLPWHIIDFFQSHTNAEVVVSPLNFSQVEVVNTRPKFKVQVLAIIGNNKGINLEKDKQELKKQLYQANIEFLEKPTREEIVDKLNERQWDILFFAGHSNSEGESQEGYIYINDNERLSIAELKNTLKNAIQRGLKLAIFNSCDGIGLARRLSDLQIPQVIVMREPIPDEVAHKFLKYFLKEFHPNQFFQSNSLPIAVRRARESLEAIENEYPYATWLPLIFQNSSHAPLIWQDFLYQPSWLEKGIIVAFSCLIVVGFILLFLHTPNDRINLEVTRFFLSVSSGVACLILSQAFQWEAKIKSGVISMKSSSAFLGFIVPFFLSLWLIPGQYVVLRNLTGLNEYPTLGLIEDQFPKPLAEILDINNEPMIDMRNPVYESIERFRDETNYQNPISDIEYADSTFNESEKTTQLGLHYKNKKIEKIAQTVLNQNQADFDNELDNYDVDTLSFIFGISTIHTSLEDANWTAITRTDYKTITQFPKLSYLIFNPNKISNLWMQRIVKTNPDVRGLLAFYYDYLRLNHDNIYNQSIDYLVNLGQPRCEQKLIDFTTPSLYVRFLDIKNNSFSTLKLESVKYKKIEQNTYQLTIVDQRDTLFQDIPAKINDYSISIPPNNHLFIPIEFGFDTRGLKKEVKDFDSPEANSFDDITDKTLFFGQVFTNPEYFINQEEHDKFNENLKLKPKDEIIKKLFIPVKFDQLFLAKTQSITSLLESIPKRFAVGTLMDIVSVRIDGKDIPVDSPFNDPRFSVSFNFGLGSCPYLLVYDSQKGYWVELGTVLTDRKSKSLQADEIYRLGSATTKVKLEERENEITYLDSVSIIYTNPETNTVEEAKLTIPELTNTDETYFILHKGDSLNIDFKKLIPHNATDVKLKINGYYEVIDIGNKQ